MWPLELWSLIFKMFDEVQQVLLEKVLDLSCEWRSKGPNSAIWNLTPPCLMWTIWRERNRRTFEDVERTSTQLQASLVSSLYEWVSGLTESNYLFFYRFDPQVHSFPFVFL